MPGDRGGDHGYLAVDEAELARLLRERRIPSEEIDAAWAVLSGDDPAGVLTSVSRSDVARVAVHLCVVRRGLVVVPPTWSLLVRGHPAARAVFYHEQQEIAALSDLGLAAPELLDRTEATFWTAHARACWAEARYWHEWARSEGQEISAESLFWANPVRTRRELVRVAEGLRATGTEVASPATDAFEAARAYYREKGLAEVFR